MHLSHPISPAVKEAHFGGSGLINADKASDRNGYLYPNGSNSIGAIRYSLEFGGTRLKRKASSSCIISFTAILY